MKKVLKNKKICIAVIVICMLILVGVIIGLALDNDADKADKENAGQDVIVYEADENTAEETDEDGLIESDSEDGPVLSEDNMIDFNGSDTESSDEKDYEDSDKNTNSTDNTNNDKDSSNNDNTDDDSNKDDSNKDDSNKDTGSWGAFY